MWGRRGRRSHAVVVGLLRLDEGDVVCRDDVDFAERHLVDVGFLVRGRLDGDGQACFAK